MFSIFAARVSWLCEDGLHHMVKSRDPIYGRNFKANYPIQNLSVRLISDVAIYILFLARKKKFYWRARQTFTDIRRTKLFRHALRTHPQSVTKASFVLFFSHKIFTSFAEFPQNFCGKFCNFNGIANFIERELKLFKKN